MQRGIANDNDPAFYGRPHGRQYTVDPFGKQNATKLTPQKSVQRPRAQSDYSAGNRPFPTVVLWVVSILVFAYCLSNPVATEYKFLSALAMVWTGFWAKYVFSTADSWRMAELSVLSILAGFTGLTWISALALEITITVPDAVMIISGLSAVLALMIKSRIVVLASIATSLFWLCLYWTDFATVSWLMLGIIPLTATQVIASIKLRSRSSILAAIVVGYAWLAAHCVGFIEAQTLPLIFCASLAFSTGFAQLRIGKSMADRDMTGHQILTYVGWVVAMVAALVFQRMWLSDDSEILVNQLPGQIGFSGWKLATFVCLIAVFASGIIRYKYTKISLIGIFLLTVVSALIPLIIWFPHFYESLLQTIPGLSAVPATGIFIGGVITAAALGTAINGVRRDSSIMMILGLVMLAIQGALLLNPAFFVADNVLIYTAGFCSAIAIGGIIAGASLAFKSPAPRMV